MFLFEETKLSVGMKDINSIFNKIKAEINDEANPEESLAKIHKTINDCDLLSKINKMIFLTELVGLILFKIQVLYPIRTYLRVIIDGFYQPDICKIMEKTRKNLDTIIQIIKNNPLSLNE